MSSIVPASSLNRRLPASPAPQGPPPNFSISVRRIIHVHLVQSQRVYTQPLKRILRDFQRDFALAQHLREVADASQQAVRDARRARERFAISCTAGSSISTCRIRAERRIICASSSGV